MCFDHLLLIGFGGPTRPEEVRPFLEEVTRGQPIPEARLREVASHYEKIGGVSPYNESVFRLKKALSGNLAERGISLPVFVGMRNWHPFLKEGILEIKKEGLQKGIGIVLAPHRSPASYEKYIQSVAEAKIRAQALDIQYEYLKPWHCHPFFIEAQADRIREKDFRDAFLLFTAHSIPLEMARGCRYAEEIEQSSALAAQALGISRWKVAYQSRSGSPREPWLEPDVLSVVHHLKEKGEKKIMLVPIGFLSENAEILYDLDMEAKNEAERIGIESRRSPTVMDHPKFVEMLGELIQEEVGARTLE